MSDKGAVEVEARYIIPDRVLYDRINAMAGFEAYARKPLSTVRITDYYLDTPGRAMLHQGWACRLRASEDRWEVTLKGPKTTQGAIVSRPELEVSLPNRTRDVSRWPHGELRDKVVDLTAGLSLRELVRIRQTRRRSLLMDGLRPVAEFSLDTVTVNAQGLRHRSSMLEIELVEGGELADLEQLDTLLQREYLLLPESRSKLRRALVLIETGDSPDLRLTHDIKPMEPEALGEIYGSSLAQSRWVAQLAERLAHDLLPLTGVAPAMTEISPCWLETLRVACLLHNIAGQASHAPAHIVGRDIIHRQPIVGMSEVNQRIIAAAIYLQRSPITSGRISEAVPEDWSPALRREALALVAIVRLASALDRVGDQTTRIRRLDRTDSVVRITLTGPHAQRDAERATRRSDLWEMLYPIRIEWGSQADSDASEAVFVSQPRNSLGINPWDAMATAARKTLGYHFQRMLEREEGTRLGEDPEELHDMRVATRRMRSAIRMYGMFLRGPLLARANDGLRRLARILGDVRDMDVAIQRAVSYVETAPPNTNLEPLLGDWRSRREHARKRMMRYLDSRTFETFVASFQRLLMDIGDAGLWASEEHTVARVAPRFVYVYWQTVRAYDAALVDAPIELYHTLRIDFKRLRYAIEFFREILPPGVVEMIPEVVSLQDHLGDMHDAAVAQEMLDEFLAGRSRQLQGVVDYRDACAANVHAGLDAFPAAWQRFGRPKVIKRFASLLEYKRNKR